MLIASLVFFVRESGWGMVGPKKSVAELTLLRRFRGTRFGGERGRVAEDMRLRARGEPPSTELVEDAEVRRSRKTDREGKAIVPGVAPGVLPAFRTGVGNALFYTQMS
jgi:hypothetical protein